MATTIKPSKIKPMGTNEQVFDNKYYQWSSNHARRKQRLCNKQSTRIVRRVYKLNLHSMIESEYGNLLEPYYDN